MVEFIREVVIRVDVDTNKRSDALVFMSIDSAREVLRKLSKARTAEEVMSIMAEGDVDP